MREAKLERNTNETQISLEINLDGTGKAEIQTGIGFFDHMLTLLAFHSEMDIKMICHGDLEVDSHHSVEDMGIALGKTILEALGDKKGITRYVIDSLIRRDGKRRRLLRVERTQAKEVRPAARQRHILADDLFNGIALNQRVQKRLWKRHGKASFL